MKIKSLIVLSFIIFLVSPMVCSALQAEEDMGSVTGFVYEKDGLTAKVNASVELQRIERSNDNEKINFKEKYISDKTDASGKYLLTKLPVGEYMVKIKVNNKKVKEKRVDFFVKILKDQTVEFSFTLQK